MAPSVPTSDFAFVREGRRPTSTFVGVALGALGAVPLIAPGEVTLLRTGVAATLLAFAVALVRPRGRTELAVSPRRRSVTDGDRSIPFDEVAGVALLGSLDLPLARSGVERYRVLLALRDDSRVEAFVDEDPAAAALVAGQIASAIGVPVLPGWGLPAGADPWVARGGGGAAGCVELVGEVRPASRRVAIAALVGGTLFTLLIARWARNHAERGAPPSALSLALAACLLGTIFATGVAVLRHRTVVSLDASRLEVQRRGVLGTRALLTLPRGEIGGAWPVTAGEDTWHVLVQTSRGPLAFRLEGSAGEALCRSLTA
ncbi:MAG: hypothetical protein IT376_18000 [Polyangiaceae bacterium]|nr:hypothetical protein [Polyangiaceae bacterium]